jgi:hypothetical protein
MIIGAFACSMGCLSREKFDEKYKVSLGMNFESLLLAKNKLTMKGTGNVFSIPWTNDIKGRPRRAFMKESFAAIKDKMKKEIEIYRTLHHSTILGTNPISAEFYECIEDGSTLFMITEFISESLNRFDEDGVETKFYKSFAKFSSKTRLGIYKQVVDAIITFTQKTNYVYYDVTPSHVRLIPNKTYYSVRLIDFSNTEKIDFYGELSDNPVCNDMIRSLSALHHKKKLIFLLKNTIQTPKLLSGPL